MGDVNKTKRLRGVYRAAVTRTQTKIINLLEQGPVLSDEEKNELLALKSAITDKLEKVKELDTKIETILIEEDEFEEEIAGILEYHDAFYELFAKIEKYLSLDESASVPDERRRRGSGSGGSISLVNEGIIRESESDHYDDKSSVASFNSSVETWPTRAQGEVLEQFPSQQQQQLQQQQQNLCRPLRAMRINGHGNGSLRLPVNIEPFDGEPLNYPSFINSFEEIIDKNTSLAAVEKFYYLRGLLKGKAKATIEGFMLTEQNYAEALGLLKERFGDKKLLQSNFIGALINLEGVADSNNTKALRTLHDKIEVNIRNLKSLQVSAEKYGTMIVPCIMQKLPREIRLKITEKLERDEDSWDFDEVLRIFNSQLTAREKCYFVGKDEKNERKTKSPPYVSSASTLTTVEGSGSGSGNPPPCFFCNQPSHKAWKCETVTDVKERKKIRRLIATLLLQNILWCA